MVFSWCIERWDEGRRLVDDLFREFGQENFFGEVRKERITHITKRKRNITEVNGHMIILPMVRISMKMSDTSAVAVHVRCQHWSHTCGGSRSHPHQLFWCWRAVPA